MRSVGGHGRQQRPGNSRTESSKSTGWRWCPTCRESWRTELLPGVTTETCPQCDSKLVPWHRSISQRSVA